MKFGLFHAFNHNSNYRKFAVNDDNMEMIKTGPIDFTPSAIKEIHRLIEAPDFNKDNYLRIGVKGGGCSGLSYILGFDEKKPEDMIYEVEGLTYIMNPAHEMYLQEMLIEWHDGLNARGFTFSNPNASKTCGCGTSFAV